MKLTYWISKDGDGCIMLWPKEPHADTRKVFLDVPAYDFWSGDDAIPDDYFPDLIRPLAKGLRRGSKRKVELRISVFPGKAVSGKWES